MNTFTATLVIFYFLMTAVSSQTTGFVSSIPNCKSMGYDANGKKICKSCNPGYLLATTQESCLRCSIECRECEGTTNHCTNCDSGKALINSTCVKCSSGCAVCTSSVFCTKCEIGYFQQTAGSCASCISGCRECATTDECITCSGGYNLKSENGKNICKIGIGFIVVITFLILTIFCIIGAKIYCTFCMRTTVSYVQESGIPDRSSFTEMDQRGFVNQPVIHVQPSVYDPQSAYCQQVLHHPQQSYVQPVVYNGNQNAYGQNLVQY